MTMTDQGDHHDYDHDHETQGHEHNHSHSHSHDHDDNTTEDTTTSSTSTSFLEKNRAHWNSQATTYTSAPWAAEMLNSIHAFILTHISWIGVPFISPSASFEYNNPSDSTTTHPSPSRRPIKVLDYACGPGTITNILYSHANSFLGIDISDRMVEEYNRRFSHSLPESVAGTNAKAVVGNLLVENPSTSTDTIPTEAEPGTFDLVAVGLGFHHFENLDLAVRRLRDYCRPDGGVLMIVDLLTHAKEDTGSVNPAKHTVAHHGFGERQVKELFERNGLTGVGFVVMQEEVLMRGTERRRVFMARGVRREGRGAGEQV